MAIMFAGLILLSRSVHAASYCVTPDFAQAASDAEEIFSGKITKVERLKTGQPVVFEYFVTFKVETWWKGKYSNETTVLWRSSLWPSSELADCGFFPVGEVGEDYLVYANPSRSTIRRDNLPEVTIFNRTSRLPANPKSESVVITDWSKQTRISSTPTLNRGDASDDIKLLRALRACGCLSLGHLPPPLDSQPMTLIQTNSRQTEEVSPCQSCLRWRLKPF